MYGKELGGSGVEEHRYDAIVVGLGAMGSAATFQLAKRGADVLGIDQYRPPHEHGSTHGDTRATRVANFEGAELVAMVRRAHEIYREIEAESGARLFDQRGSLIFGTPGGTGYHNVEDPFKSTITAAQQHDVWHELLTPDEVHERWPVFGFQGNETAYFEPEGGVLFPERCVEAQLELAERHGARLATQEVVQSFASHKNSVSVTTTDAKTNQERTYEADKLVVAAGPWVKKILPEYERHFRLERQILYWFDLEDKSPENYELYNQIPRGGWAYGDGAYFFPALDGPDGGVKLACEVGTEVDSPEAVDREVSKAEINRMYENNVKDRLPGLSNERVRTATCLYTMTPDGKFIIDRHPDKENVVVLSPCNGNGFKHSAAIGEVAAQLALDGRSDLDISKFAMGRSFTG